MAVVGQRQAGGAGARRRGQGEIGAGGRGFDGRQGNRRAAGFGA